jgi:hypothetical protein
VVSRFPAGPCTFLHLTQINFSDLLYRHGNKKWTLRRGSVLIGLSKLLLFTRSGLPCNWFIAVFSRYKLHLLFIINTSCTSRTHNTVLLTLRWQIVRVLYTQQNSFVGLHVDFPKWVQLLITICAHTTALVICYQWCLGTLYATCIWTLDYRCYNH